MRRMSGGPLRRRPVNSPSFVRFAIAGRYLRPEKLGGKSSDQTRVGRSESIRRAGVARRLRSRHRDARDPPSRDTSVRRGRRVALGLTFMTTSSPFTISITHYS
jgi:hypothetical protein